MDHAKFIYQIETEFNYAMLNRIQQIFSRSRIPIQELQATLLNDKQRFVVAMEGNREYAHKLAKKIAGQVDVLMVTLYEEASPGFRTELLDTKGGDP
ncbi:MAG TPA: hypothetical protein VFI06_14830 [Chitinophagaceae bacterium]|nr:hypothetical protein [Chitinophagaceae bacterium]